LRERGGAVDGQIRAGDEHLQITSVPAAVKQYRLNRLFHPTSGRCFDVAVDHGMPGEAAMLTGIEDMERALVVLIEAKPDAIQLSVGQADLLQRHPGRDKPALVLRTDTPNIYAPEAPAEGWSFMIDDPVGHAIRLDAACVVVNLLDVPGQDQLRRDCLDNISALRAECDRAAMPLMVEPLAFEPGGGGGYASSGDVERIMGLVRQAVELGADVIKADPSDDLSEYHRVVEVARVPLLLRGGGRVTDQEILERTHAVLEQGAKGIVYGRNVIQHEHPAAMTAALMSVVHDGVKPAEALASLPR
jgi:DhnA family fructose-bisphosphate aldolase class Ia